MIKCQNAGCLYGSMSRKPLCSACFSVHHPLTCLLQTQYVLGKPAAGTAALGGPPNAVEVLSNFLSGKQLQLASQVVVSLLHPNAMDRTTLTNINLDFLQ